MKLYEEKRPHGDIVYIGRKHGFKFTLDDAYGTNGWYVVAIHSKKDIRFNSLWGKGGVFDTLDDATAFCENFDYKKHKCLGSDVGK